MTTVRPKNAAHSTTVNTFSDISPPPPPPHTHTQPRSDFLEVQSPGHPHGAELLEARWRCPTGPDHLHHCTGDVQNDVACTTHEHGLVPVSAIRPEPGLTSYGCLQGRASPHVDKSLTISYTCTRYIVFRKVDSALFI